MDHSSNSVCCATWHPTVLSCIVSDQKSGHSYGNIVPKNPCQSVALSLIQKSNCHSSALYVFTPHSSQVLQNNTSRWYSWSFMLVRFSCHLEKYDYEQTIILGLDWLWLCTRIRHLFIRWRRKSSRGKKEGKRKECSIHHAGLRRLWWKTGAILRACLFGTVLLLQHKYLPLLIPDKNSCEKCSSQITCLSLCN